VDIYASDEEKGEEIKQWWRDHGLSVIVACVLVISGLFGSRYWVSYQHLQTETASLAYQTVVNAISDNNDKQAEDKATELLSEYTNTPYAVFAAFEMSKYMESKADLATTKTYLNWIIEHASLSGQVDIARLRLAQVLLAENQYDQAISITEQSNSSAFASLFSELRGDIYAAQDQKQQARTAYQTALLSLVANDPRQQIIMLKLDDMASSHDG